MVKPSPSYDVASDALLDSPASSPFLRAPLCGPGRPQIRNVATLGGNLVTASPIADLPPIWVAAGAVLHLASTLPPPSEPGAPVSSPAASPAASEDGLLWRRVRAGPDFFLGYRKVDMRAEEVLVGVTLPPVGRWEYVREFKQSRRR